MKLRIFTDGACSGNPGPGGWAALLALPKEREIISGYEEETTNNRMELMAVVRAIGHVCMVKPKSDEAIISDYDGLEIHSDSAYVVNAINKHWLMKWRMNGWKTSDGENVKNMELWEHLLYYLENMEMAGMNVKFIKVKGHSGITLNELVDERARNESLIAKKKVEARKDVVAL